MFKVVTLIRLELNIPKTAGDRPSATMHHN